MLMCNHKIRINLMRCLRISTARCEIGQCIQNDTLSLSLRHHQSDIVSCYGKRYEKRYVNDGDKRYRNDATRIDYFLPVMLHSETSRQLTQNKNV